MKKNILIVLSCLVLFSFFACANQNKKEEASFEDSENGDFQTDFPNMSREIESNTGESNTGESNTGESNTEESNTEESNTEESNTEESNTEESNTEESNTGNSGIYSGDWTKDYPIPRK